MAINKIFTQSLTHVVFDLALKVKDCCQLCMLSVSMLCKRQYNVSLVLTRVFSLVYSLISIFQFVFN